MKDELENFIMTQFEIEEDTTFEFRELYGFTFVFQKSIFTYHENFSSGEIKPVGIIYEENGEFYLAPLDEVIKIEAIVKEYVKENLKL